MPQKLKNFWNQSFFKLQTSMIAQNDRNKILSNYFFPTLFSWLPKKIEKWQKNVIFYPKNAQKIEKKLESAIFQDTDLNDSLK